MIHRLIISLVVILGTPVGPASAAEGRTYVRVVGSSSIRPLADAVADRVGKSGKHKRPLVEATGTGGGIRLFCEGLGADYPDIANASRRMKDTERAFCRSRGVTKVVEVKIGYGGVVLAHSKQHPPMSLTRKHLFLALAKEVPDPLCPSCTQLVPNRVTRWKELDPTLPDLRIKVLGPPISSGTREVFSEAVMLAGCEALPGIEAQKEKEELCEAMREDGAYLEASGETIVRKLRSDADAIGIIAYSLLHKYAEDLDTVRIEGSTPDARSIASHEYPLSRPLFFYLKEQHIGKVSGLEQYVTEFTSEKAWGDKGYLVPIGLIPLSKSDRIASAPENL